MIAGFPIRNGNQISGYIVLDRGIEILMRSEPDAWHVQVCEVQTDTNEILSFMLTPNLDFEKKNDEIIFSRTAPKRKEVSELDEAIQKGLIVYGIGRRDETGAFGVSHGPTTNLEELLEVFSSSGFYILQLSGEFEKDSILYEWDAEKLEWRRCAQTIEVHLTYFKRTGKYYSGGSYISNAKPLHEIWDDVKRLMQDGKLPGLVEGANDFIVEINVPDHENAHPKLIIPPRNES
jgi:hypothetical protein